VDRDKDTLSLGDHVEMVGQTGFIPGAGGGNCPGCHRRVATLLPGGKCARCTAPAGLGEGDFTLPLRPRRNR